MIPQAINRDSGACIGPHGESRLRPEDCLAKAAACLRYRYDPVHYMAPEGGYATDPDGAERTLEFRQMVQARGWPWHCSMTCTLQQGPSL